jgi:hypothetical protein
MIVNRDNSVCTEISVNGLSKFEVILTFCLLYFVVRIALSICVVKLVSVIS